MKYVILDTNFILSCIRKKIDFSEKIKFMGMKIIIPVQVIGELKKHSETKNLKLRDESKLALSILTINNFDEVDLQSKNVDNGIINLAKKNPEYAIATLDRGIKNRIKNNKLVIKGDKELEIV